MNKKKYKVYTLWELAIPIKDLQSSCIEKGNLFVHWNGVVRPKKRDERTVDSLDEADRLRRELVPSKEKVRDFQRIIQCINKDDYNFGSRVILNVNLIMEIHLGEDILIIRTRQHPCIHKIEKIRLYGELPSDITLNTDIKWDYESQLIRKRASYYQVYCPLCNEWFGGSSYLFTVFTDERSLWLANMVTHYRHSHIISWDKMWGRYGGYYQQAAHYHDEDYEVRKSEINERAKRQIVRKATEFLKNNNIGMDVFNSLQGTTDKTIGVVNNFLGCRNQL